MRAKLPPMPSSASLVPRGTASSRVGAIPAIPERERALKIVILGKGKSGTTVLVHMIAAAFPECRPVTGGFHVHARERRVAAAGDDSFVCKFTYNDKKGRSFDAVMRHIVEEGYDKKIWVTRDPRDNVVSDALFRWRRRHGKSRRQYQACLPRVERKEREPGAVAFHEIHRYTGDPGGPETLEQMVENEGRRYREMCDFVRGLGPDWFVFKYEDLVEERLAALSDYLGREIRPSSELRGADRVKARTKSYGDWRNWFTEEDVRVFAPLYSPYMELVGYDADDWRIASEPSIDPAKASGYMRHIATEGRFDLVRILRDAVASPRKTWKRLRSRGAA
jgi:hypothetical protein